ncbi:hypothetical protein FSP39_023522 [Pinctada imbricata]|uniref:C2H2-type domain-containing protein n=1 Tax=Pinctada imbricata TaxID=66713 RepID=A0AA89C821_PINIB|nr:hypothetical protein FSP39_023522 [Pinctada imbricata]
MDLRLMVPHQRKLKVRQTRRSHQRQKGCTAKTVSTRRVKEEKEVSLSSLAAVSTTLDAAFSQVSLEPKQAENAPGRKDALPDPYEFNAKVEDGIGVPVKKIKSEKDKVDGHVTDATVDRCVGTELRHVGTEMDPDCLGPCDPGTQVTLDGIVWQETDAGVLVVNVTWRGKTYVGTLLDATKHDWAPPRPNCDSPISDFETRTPKGRAKRGRGASVGTPVNDKLLEGRKLRKGRRGSSVNSNTFQAPPSPAKSDTGTPSGGVKRKGRPQENDPTEKANKRSRSCSRGTPSNESSNSNTSVMLECPEPNCNKKYKDSNALKYHQSHKHNSSSLINVDGDDDSRDNCLDNNEDSMLDDVDSNIGDGAQSDVNVNTATDGKVDIENMEEDSVCSSSVNMTRKRCDEESTEKESECKDKKSENTKEETSANNKCVSDSATEIQKQKKDTANTSVISPISVQQPVNVTIAAATPFHIVPTPVPSFGGTLSTTKPGSTVQSSPIPATIVTATPIQSAIPITVTATTPQMLDIKHDHNKPTEKLIRPKSTVNRPIMPSNMIALTTTVNVTHF